MQITVEWIFGLIVTGVSGIIAWSLKELYAQFKEDKKETKKALAEQNEKFEKLPEKYALKEDFYRELNKLDMKLDNMRLEIRDDISELNKNVSNLITMTTKVHENRGN